MSKHDCGINLRKSSKKETSKDRRRGNECQIGQYYIFHRGLKQNLVDTKLVVYPREGHGLREEKHRIDVLNRMLNWFAKYLE